MTVKYTSHSFHSFYTKNQSILFFPSNLVSIFTNFSKLSHFHVQPYTSLFDIIEFLSCTKLATKDSSTASIIKESRELRDYHGTRALRRDGEDGKSPPDANSCERVIIFLNSNYSNTSSTSNTCHHESNEMEQTKLSILKDFYSQIDKLHVTSVLFVHFLSEENVSRSNEKSESKLGHLRPGSSITAHGSRSKGSSPLAPVNISPSKVLQRSRFVVHLPFAAIPYFESVLLGEEVVSFGEFADDTSAYITLQQFMYGLNHCLVRLPEPSITPTIHQFSEAAQGNFYFENMRGGPYIYGDELHGENLNQCVHNREFLTHLMSCVHEELSKLNGIPLVQQVLIYGCSGSGKRTVCNTLCKSKEIRTLYARQGGIFKVSLHEKFGASNFQILSVQTSLIRMIKQHELKCSKYKESHENYNLPAFGTTKEAKEWLYSYFSSLTQKQQTLLIVHGVTNVDHLNAFIFSTQTCPYVRVIFTSENIRFGLALANSKAPPTELKSLLPIEMKPLSFDNVESLFRLRTGITQSKLPRKLCEEIATFCKYHPLTLTILISHLKACLTSTKLTADEIYLQWREEFSALRSFGLSSNFKMCLSSYLERLESMKDHVQKASLFTQYQNMFQVISYITHDIEFESRNTYLGFLQCVVFKPNEKIPLLILKLLWEQNGISSNEFLNVLQKLHSLNLIYIHSYAETTIKPIQKSIEDDIPDSTPPTSQVPIPQVPLTQIEVDTSPQIQQRDTYISIHPLISQYLLIKSQERSQDLRRKDPILRPDIDLINRHMKMLEAFAKISKS